MMNCFGLVLLFLPQFAVAVSVNAPKLATSTSAGVPHDVARTSAKPLVRTEAPVSPPAALVQATDKLPSIANTPAGNAVDAVASAATTTISAAEGRLMSILMPVIGTTWASATSACADALSAHLPWRPYMIVPIREQPGCTALSFSVLLAAGALVLATGACLLLLVSWLTSALLSRRGIGPWKDPRGSRSSTNEQQPPQMASMVDRSKIIEFELRGERIQARARRTMTKPEQGPDSLPNRIHRIEFLSGSAEGRTGWVILDEEKMILRPCHRRSEQLPFRFLGARSNHWPGGAVKGPRGDGAGDRFVENKDDDSHDFIARSGSRKTPLWGSLARQDTNNCRIVYDAEVKKKLDLGSMAYVACCHCGCYNPSRSYIYLRENSVESNLALQSCCGCGGPKDVTNVYYFDSGPYNIGPNCMWWNCVPCCCTVSSPKLTAVDVGCMLCASRCDPLARDSKQLAFTPFENCPVPVCCCTNITGKGAFPGPFENCFDFCGPVTGQPRFYSTILPQPENVAEFDAFAQQVMSGMIPPDDFVPVIEQCKKENINASGA